MKKYSIAEPKPPITNNQLHLLLIGCLGMKNALDRNIKLKTIATIPQTQIGIMLCKAT